MTSVNRSYSSIINPTLLIVSLGYFVDVFDLFLFNALRIPSLRDLGLNDDAITKVGLHILNLQVAGMLLGGIIWGVLGDKIGRKKALIGSVLLYSLGSLACSVIHSVPAYAIARFLTGVGLAGEMGLGAVLIVETLPDAKRNWALAIYGAFSLASIFLANALAGFIPWRMCYAVGGIAGLLLLSARVMMVESGLFESLIQAASPRGSLRLLFKNVNLLKRYLCCIFFTMPYFYMVNVLVTLAPEFGRAVGVGVPIKANIALLVYSMGAGVADLAATFLCRLLQNRKRAIFIYMSAALIMAICYLSLNHPSEATFYTICAVMGLCNFWVLMLFMSVEQFGTNMRATLGVSALSTGRATLIISNSVFLALRGSGLNLISSASWVAALVFGVGFLSLLGLRETYHQGMDFIEEKVKKLS